MLLADILSIIGSDISTKNGKMPGSSFGLTTDLCNIGGKLRQTVGSVCHQCYAKRLEDFRPNVHTGYMKRTLAVIKYSKTAVTRRVWAEAMAYRIGMTAERTGVKYHRWHDSGDLQSANHLKMLILVAELTPEVHFWLPTREIKLISTCEEVIPSNLTVRMSAPLIDCTLQPKSIPKGITSSSVHKDMPAKGFKCPSSTQGNKCLDCRACWSRSVKNVSYHKH